MVLNTKQPNIIIIGDIMLDHNIYGTISKLANEAPIPVLNKKNEIFSLGGCGNVLTNLYSLGCNNLFLFSMISIFIDGGDFIPLILFFLKLDSWFTSKPCIISGLKKLFSN